MEERSRWSSWSEGGSTALGPLLEEATSPAFADLLLSQVTRPCRSEVEHVQDFQFWHVAL